MRLVFLFLACCTALFACGKKDAPATNPTPPAVDSPKASVIYKYVGHHKANGEIDYYGYGFPEKLDTTLVDSATVTIHPDGTIWTSVRMFHLVEGPSDVFPYYMDSTVFKADSSSLYSKLGSKYKYYDSTRLYNGGRDLIWYRYRSYDVRGGLIDTFRCSKL